MTKKQLKRSLNSKKPKRRSNRKSKGLAAAFLGQTHAVVRDTMAATETLPQFREIDDELSKDEQLLIVNQALVLIQDTYVHLPLKENMYAVRPVQALRLLKQKLETTPDAMSDLDFHREMITIFTSVRDLHTNYILPSPYASKTAFLPFLLEPYFDDGERRYLVSHMVGGFEHDIFQPGVEVINWNGAPIDLAVAANANRFAGSNAPARLARGIERMTIRPLIQSLPPDENTVLIDYRTEDGTMHEIRFDWLVFSPGASDGALLELPSFEANTAAIGLDIDAQVASQAKKALFAPSVIEAEAAVAARGLRSRKRNFKAGEAIPSSMPSVFAAKKVETASGEFGHIRIHTFSVQDADEFVDEFIRLADLLPDTGLIIDVRGNGGGLIHAGEQLLQVLTPREIEPERTQFINTAQTLSLVRRHSPSSFSNFSLQPWRKSMEEAILTGANFSRGFPITDPADANSIGQRYHGPSVLITDAKCYSTTDIFAAGFQDHNIGPVIGVDNNTGAGGANVWTIGLLQQLAGPEGPYKALPKGASMRVSIRRTLRVGERAGSLVEDLGVTPDHLHQLTRRDLLDGNKDLIEFGGQILSALPVRTLEGDLTTTGSGAAQLTVTTAGLVRVDVYLDDRPIGAIDVDDGSTSIEIDDLGGASKVFLEGLDTSGALVAARRLHI